VFWKPTRTVTRGASKNISKRLETEISSPSCVQLYFISKLNLLKFTNSNLMVITDVVVLIASNSYDTHVSALLSSSLQHTTLKISFYSRVRAQTGYQACSPVHTDFNTCNIKFAVYKLVLYFDKERRYEL
jgi:hypothetical protein